MLSPTQIAAILEQFEVPARLCDAGGNVTAQNHLGEEIAPPSRWDEGERSTLGDGWTLVVLHRDGEHAPNALQDIGTLANGMAHSIRNPLSSIVTAASLVQDDPNVTEETAMLLGIITKESRHLNRILTDFLNYVRPRPSHPERLDVAETMRHLLREMARENSLANIEIGDEMADELWVEGDETQVEQALRNIVLNAAEAMREGGVLGLRGGAQDETVWLEIEDDGRGFSAKELSRAFDPFYSNTSEGTGLGLTIALSTFAAMNGSVRAENKGEQGGARLRIELPRSR